MPTELFFWQGLRYGCCLEEVSILVGCSVLLCPHTAGKVNIEQWNAWNVEHMINLMQIDLSRFVARFLSFSVIVGGLALYHDQCVNAVHYVLRVIYS